MLAHPGTAYGILFTGNYGDGRVKLNISECAGDYEIHWLNLDTGDLDSSKSVHDNEVIDIQIPQAVSSFGWLAAVVRK
jgi:hypothetical protein